MWNFWEHFLYNSSERLLLTIQVHKIHKSVSRYCNKDIKLIEIEAILGSITVCQFWKWFCMLRKLWKRPSRNLSTSQKFWRAISVGELFYSETMFFPFTVILYITLKLIILWNFILKLQILVSTLLFLDCLSQTLKC